MAEAEDLDFSNFDGIDELDWSDVEGELKKNKEMIKAEAEGGSGSVENIFDSAPSAAGAGGQKIASPSDLDINFLLDVPLKLTVEVGRTRMYIKHLLELDIDSVMELNKKLGEPLNVYINNKPVAKGEIIIQNEKFGLKITHIISQEERLESIKNI